MVRAKAALTVAAASVTAVAAAAAAAGAAPPQLVERGHDLNEFALAGNASGERVLVVPREITDGPSGLNVFTAAPGADFGHATRIRGRDVPGFSAPVAVAPGGAVAIVGMRPVTGPDDPRRLVALVRDPGAAFTKPEPISARNADDASVAFDRQGTAMAIWTRGTDNSFAEYVEVSTRPPRGGWSKPVRVAYERCGGSAPQVTFDAAGDAVAVWTRDCAAKSRGQIVSSTRPAGASFGRPQTVSDPRFDSEEASLSVNAAGQAAIAWVLSTRNDEHIRIGAAFRDDPAKPFGHPRFLTPDGHDAFGPSIAIDEQGRSLAVWAIPGARGSNEDSSGFQTVAAVRAPGGPVGHRQTVSDGHADFPVLAMAPDGHAVIAWPRNSRNGDLVQERTASTAAAFGRIRSISPRGTIDGLQAHIADDHSVLIAWSRESGGRTSLEAVRLAR
jgi:hypothetical protein